MEHNHETCPVCQGEQTPTSTGEYIILFVTAACVTIFSTVAVAHWPWLGNLAMYALLTLIVYLIVRKRDVHPPDPPVE